MPIVNSVGPVMPDLPFLQSPLRGTLKINCILLSTFIPVHLMCTHRYHPFHKIELLLTPVRQIEQGHPPSFTSLTLTQNSIILILSTFTVGPLDSIPFFHRRNLSLAFVWFTATSTRSSAYRDSKGRPVLKSLASTLR